MDDAPTLDERRDALVEAARRWLGISAGASSPDAQALPGVAAAVLDFVDGLPGEWNERRRLGAEMLTARLIRRRNSPGGVEAFTETGAVYVSRNDPDVALLLSLDRYKRPRVG